jgi:hypothetical protein
MGEIGFLAVFFILFVVACACFVCYLIGRFATWIRLDKSIDRFVIWVYKRARQALRRRR